MAETTLERSAWMFPLVAGILAILSGLYLVFYARPGPGELAGFSSLGTTWEQLMVTDPGLAGYLTQLFVFVGASFTVVGILLAAISATAFRQGERWAWYTLWALPPLYVMVIVVDYMSRFPHLWQFYSIPLALVLVGLLLSIRRVFPRGTSSRP